MESIRLLAGPESYNRSRLVFLGLIVVVFSLLPAPPEALAQEQKTYVSQKYGFAFQYPSYYELKLTADCYIDFKKGGETSFTLRVDDQFISRLYYILHPPPHMIMYFPRRGEEDPRRKLARETRKNPELFRRYARQEVKNWCSADGPDGSNYCQEFKSDKPFTSRGRLDCIEFYPIMTREDFTNDTKQQQIVGPVFGVYLPKEDLPLVLIISPRQGNSASPALVQDMREVIDSLKVTP
jgi:hypothetical protein